MFRKVNRLSLFLIAAALLAACAPAAKTPDAMMETKPASAAMTNATPTVDTMMANSTFTPTADAMMDKGTATPTADAMMDKGMTSTPDAMMDHGTTTPTVDAMMEAGTATPTADAMMDHTTPTADAMGQNIPSTGMDDKMGAMLADKALTNAANGNTFKLSEFKGKVVLVAPFAQDCAACLAQQQELAKLNKLLGMDSGLVTVSLDVEPMDHADMLKTYLTQHGFDWHFAVASPEVTQELSQLYGQKSLNPATAPLLVIDRQGAAHPLKAGMMSAADLQKALEPYLKAGM